MLISFYMMYLVLLVVLCCLSRMCKGYSVVVEEDTECFTIYALAGTTCSGRFELLTEDTKMLVSLRGPTGFQHFKSSYDSSLSTEDNKDPTEFEIEVEGSGDYHLCFTNGNENATDVTPITSVFNLHVSSIKHAGDRPDYNSLLLELENLQQGVEDLKDHQKFMSQREDLHREDLEEIKSDVMWWTVAESVILLLLSVGQIYYISRFFEIKRRV
jgi:p24 family protein beta-1